MSDSHQSSPEAPGTHNGPVGSPSRIIRRAPTGAIPVVTEDPEIPASPGTDHTPRPSPHAAISACVLALIGWWATSVVTTDVIASWWHSDRLFCIAVGFLSVASAGTTVSGVMLLLLRQPLGRYLLLIGAGIALLTFGSLFVAGARLPWIVHTIPVIHLGAVVAALHPATLRWIDRS